MRRVAAHDLDQRCRSTVAKSGAWYRDGFPIVEPGALGWRRHMRNIVDEAGEIIAKASDDHTLLGGHHRLAVAASLGRKLFWKDTGEPVKLDPYFKGSSDRHTA